MSDLEFPTSAAALLRGVDSLLVVAPRRAFAAKGFLAAALPDGIVRAARQVAGALSVGDLGSVGETWVEGAKVPHLAVAVLPDVVSRHHAPSRPECIRHVVLKAARRGDRRAVLIVVDDAAHALAAANAVGRALPGLSLKSSTKTAQKPRILLTDTEGTVIRLDAPVRETVQMARTAAELVDRPPTELDPAGFAAAAKRVLRGIQGVKIQEFRGAKLLEAKLGAIHAVGRTAVSEPRLVIASYRPARAQGPHVALVGKGITYDTGGLHLKGRGAMETMKGDMGGAAAVLGAMRVLAASGGRQRVTLLLCLAENAIGPTAYKPDDVITMHSGKTVEINNTDAEGRLVLADGCSYAARKLGADVILDAATLTGAQLIATGNAHAAVVSNDEDLEALAVAAGRHTGDLVHPLPFAPELYQSEFSSPLADMRNSVKNRSNAQTSCAAQFVFSHLEGTDVRWLHVDMAGPSHRDQRGTGYGVALLSELVRRLA